jgi:hypothetical protein
MHEPNKLQPTGTYCEDADYFGVIPYGRRRNGKEYVDGDSKMKMKIDVKTKMKMKMKMKMKIEEDH